MKYHYFYQDKTNADLDGWIEARDRNDAYQKLKRQKIKPYKLIGRNPLAWKRWAAIAVLAFLCTGLGIYAYKAQKTVAEVMSEIAELDRDQLYGDPYTIQKISANGWRASFPDEGDAWLARHAIPGKACDCINRLSLTNTLSVVRLDVDDADSLELKKMKKMVNAMKHELDDYLRGGGSQLDYMKLCNERIEQEQKIFRRAEVQFNTLRSRRKAIPAEKFMSDWERINDSLRALGLPTVVIPMD